MNPHVPNCDKETCEVCHSWLTETREVFRPLYIHIRYNLRYNPETAQERLTAYTEQ